MSQRRMFSQRIINSARFLKMSLSAQALYFHLGMKADDDGVVEAWPVMQMTSAAEDDLRVLIAKEFIKILNEDHVTYIMDWKEHNQIRADRKVNSIYKELLLQVMPGVDLTQPKARSDVIDNSHRIAGLSTDGIGKGRLGKVNIRKYIKENKTPNTKQLKVGLSFIESIRKQIKDKKG